MKQVTTYKNQKVLVLGLAKSGVNAARLLKKLGAFVTANDAKPFDENPDAKELVNDGIKVVTGSNPVSLLDEDFSLIVKNPGIPYSNSLIQAAQSRNIPIITEVELAAQVNDAELIGVTGTNGKTTVTTMITEMLNQDRPVGKAKFAGNIGVPASQVVQTLTKDDVMVTELSSFMLTGIKTLHPHIAVITNMYTAHIDWHGSREAYVAAKMRITMNQTADDFLVMNWDLPEQHELAKQSKAQIIKVSRKGAADADAYVADGQLMWRGEAILPVDQINVPGIQNVENALAALAAAKVAGQSNAAIATTLSHFNGVRHRLQYVLTYKDRKFYNDSKATDIEATQMALRGFKQPVVLMAGGLDRGFTFDRLVDDLKAHVKAVVLFGQTKDLLADAAKKAGITEIHFADDAVAAVPEAYKLSQPGDVVLLSPANASWDQFPSFEVRGDKFIKAVEQLSGEKEQQA
ncbi:UDP-N-acetylmuramoyl-L-alanine--D-glutamate ligase [Furfurilactobacillus milii]|uniref:UDP-N-acetylmuramoylalanine--D-glutamate ligase n=1 Tax=Furfurilactobacillus rossiae TaxID=231049 RepID=A0A7C9MSC2_9LACO|nr:UDP-N-acetylmuramoyl-L-alanine--D-glutamate ligase [Furfurilactobacillus milii]